MRVMIVGAGAVGVVIGVSLEHLKHEVLYLVRPGRKREMRSLLLVDATRGQARRRDAPAAYEHGTKLPPFEWVLVCVRGDQLDEAMATVAAHARPDATVGLAAAAGPDALARARAAHPGGPVFAIHPVFSAWSEEPGVWRWFNPPLLKTLCSGEGDEKADAVAREFAAALDAAGVPARAVPSARAIVEPLLSTGVAVLAGWELSDWDLGRFAADRELRRLTAAAMRDGAAIAGREIGGALSRALRLTPAPAFSLLIAALPRLSTESMRAMWSHHGPKLRAQTRSLLDALLARADAARLPSTKLRELRARLPPL